MSKTYTRQEISNIDSEIREASLTNIKTWDSIYKKYSNIPVTIEMPLGELTNPNIKGFILGANIKGTLQYPFPITSSDHFDAQGLEGKFRIHSDMIVAILIHRELNPSRIQIRKNHIKGKI